MSQELENDLEALVDRHGLYAVVEALESMCHGKAEHLATNWQDKPAAANWTKAAGAFGKLSARLCAIQLP